VISEIMSSDISIETGGNAIEILAALEFYV
jgi:hypothetical protein